MKIKNKLLLVSITTLSLLTACKPPLLFIEKEGTEYKDRQQLIFTHQWQRGSKDYAAVNAMIKKFNESEVAKSLNVFVKGDGINFWDYWDKVNLSISGGSSPDIYIHEIANAPTRMGGNLNLTKMYEADLENGEETLNAEEMFFDSQISDIARYSENGKDLYAWPFSSTVRVVYYNKDLFKAAGIEKIPTTWAEMEDINRKLTIYNNPSDPNSGYKQVGFDPFTAEGQYIHQWGWLANHSFWSEGSNGKPIPNFDDKTLIENINKLYTAYPRRNNDARDDLQKFMSKYAQNGSNPFVTGELAMVINNEGLNTTLKEANVPFEYGVFEIPPLDSSVEYTNWSSSYSIELYDNNNRKVSKEVAKQRNKGAWEFLKFMYQEEFQSVIANAGFMLSNKLFHDKFINNDPILSELAKAIEHTREAEYIKAAPKWTSDIQVYVNNIYSRDMNVEEAMKSCQKLMLSKIEQYYEVNGN